MIEFENNFYARVSDILRPFQKFNHIDPLVLANKASIGTEAHKAIAEYACDGFSVPTERSSGYFDSFLKWQESSEAKFLESETRYYCDTMMITGQIDALMSIPGTQDPVLVDFKTSVAEAPVVWPLQAHLYAYLLRMNGHVIAPYYLFIRLDKHGSHPKVHCYKATSAIEDLGFNAVKEFFLQNTST